MLAVCCVLSGDGIVGVALFKQSVDVLPCGERGMFIQYAEATVTRSRGLVVIAVCLGRPAAKECYVPLLVCGLAFYQLVPVRQAG